LLKTLAGIPKHIAAAGADVAIGLGLFCFIVSLVGAEPGGRAATPLSDLVAISANAAEIARMPDQPAAAAQAAEVVKSAVPVTQEASSLFRFTDQKTAMWMLAAIFSALFAFNLTLLRHLKRQHAPSRPRRRGY
jgi:hypothetical protein